MKTIKQIYECVINDSRIDFPHEGLTSTVWDKNDKGYILKEEVRDIILKAIKIIKENSEFNDIIYKARIVGSICSNQYTLASDIDIHFLIKRIPKDTGIDELNNELETYCKKNEYLSKLYIDTHQVNFYFQPNEYQDLMSAGVYDIDSDEWLIGPTEVPLDFNPYDEFSDAFPIVGKYIKKIENVLNRIKIAIDLYEIDQSELHNRNIVKEISNLKAIKKELKHYRHSFSKPTTAEEAKEYRDDKEWQRIDAVFKFMDKFGYLRKITLINNLIEDDSNEINKDKIEKLKGLI